MKRITTQTRDPQLPGITHIPCQEVRPVLHLGVAVNEHHYLLITSENAWNHWRQRDCASQVREAIVVGSGAYLEREGIACRTYRFAQDIRLKGDHRYLWLHGNVWSRDFSRELNKNRLTRVQTYETQIDLDACERVKAARPDELWVYSSQVIKALESLSVWPNTLLYHSGSCVPTKGKWGKTRCVYPGAV